jgi:hypothetical protein
MIKGYLFCKLIGIFNTGERPGMAGKAIRNGCESNQDRLEKRSGLVGREAGDANSQALPPIGDGDTIGRSD